MNDHIERRGQKQNVMNDVGEFCLSLSWILGFLDSFLNFILLLFASYIKKKETTSPSCTCFLLKRRTFYVKNSV